MGVEWDEAAEASATGSLGFNQRVNFWESFCFSFGGSEDMMARDEEVPCGRDYINDTTIRCWYLSNQTNFAVELILPVSSLT